MEDPDSNISKTDADSDCLAHFSPLNIPYILQLILKNLSTWNLCKCRLVCKYWKDEITSVLAKRSKIIIKSEQCLEKFDEFHPFLSQLCHSFEFKNEVKLKIPKSQLFFKKFGSNIKSLDISFLHDYGAESIEEMFPHLENLEELCLNGRAHFLYEEASRETLINGFSHLKSLFIYDSSFDLNGFEPRRIWAENVFHILAGAPNLEKVYYAPFLESRAKMFFEILKCQPVQHRRLSHLHINHLWMNPSETKMLISQKYSLKYVHLVLTSELDRNSLNELLSSIKETLRELTLTFTDGTSCLEFHPIEPLSKLKKLSMIGYDGPLIVSNAPELNLLVISLPENRISPEKIDVNPDLEELEIYDFQVKYNINDLKTLLRKFNQVRFLKVNNISNDILRTIYTCLPELRELRTCFHKFYGVDSGRIDCGLNGLGSKQLDEELLDIWDDKAVSHLRLNPWIGNLKHLKHLTLEVGLLSDFGIVLGVSRCRSMKELVLKNTSFQTADFEVETSDPRITMTNRSLQAITQEMDLDYLQLDGFSSLFTLDAIEYAKKCMAGREFVII